MTTGVVVGSILLAADQLLGMEKLLVGSGSNLVDHSRLQVNKDSPGDVLAGPTLGKEGAEGVVADSSGLVGRHLAVRLNSMLEARKTNFSVSFILVKGPEFISN